MAKKFRTKKGKNGRPKKYPVGGRESTDLDFGRDPGSKSNTDLTSHNPLFEGSTSLDGKEKTSLDIGQDRGTKSRTDLTGGNPVFEDGAEKEEKLLESDTSIDPLKGDTSLAWGKGKSGKDKEKFSIAPSDDWHVDPDTGEDEGGHSPEETTQSGDTTSHKVVQKLIGAHHHEGDEKE